MTEERDNIVVLTDENGEDQEFEHIDTILFKDSYYVALTPLTDEAEEDDDDLEQEVYIMKVVKENDQDALVMVDDEEELDEVFEEFQMRFEDEDGEE